MYLQVDFLIKSSFELNFSSNKVNDDIRHQEIEQIKYIKYFSGHEDRVVCLEMCPGQEGTCLTVFHPRNAVQKCFSLEVETEQYVCGTCVLHYVKDL